LGTSRTLRRSRRTLLSGTVLGASTTGEGSRPAGGQLCCSSLMAHWAVAVAGALAGALPGAGRGISRGIGRGRQGHGSLVKAPRRQRVPAALPVPEQCCVCRVLYRALVSR
jgi:hypothetical protein